MFHVSSIKNWFMGKANDFNKIAEFLNNLCGDGFIRVYRPDKPSNGSPPTISLDTEKLRMLLGDNSVTNPKDVDDMTTSSGIATGIDPMTDTKTFGSTSVPGCEIYIACRGADVGDGENGRIYFRKVRISGDGRICLIDSEGPALGVYLSVSV